MLSQHRSHFQLSPSEGRRAAGRTSIAARQTGIMATGRLFRNLFLLLLALSGVLAASNLVPGDNEPPNNAAAPQADPADHQEPLSDVDITPTSIGTYIAELFGTLAGLAWGLYASFPTFG